jgi:SAM-dependent methyltransferase
MPEPHAREQSQLAPSAWVTQFGAGVPRGGTVLDLACGGGRHARWFHARGHPVLMVDRDIAGVLDLSCQARAEVLQADLELAGDWVLKDRRFGVVIVANYLHRPLFPHILAAVAAGGLLVYETFAIGNERFGRPSNPDYLLQQGELLQLMPPQFEVLAFEDIELQQPKPAMVQHIAARRLV